METRTRPSQTDFNRTSVNEKNDPHQFYDLFDCDINR